MKKAIWSICFLLIGFMVVKAQQTEEPKGKLLFKENKCITCHAVESQGFVKKGKSSAPDLSDVGNSLKPEFMTKYLKKEEKLNDAKHMGNFKGSQDELKVLVDWLSSLKKSKK